MNTHFVALFLSYALTTSATGGVIKVVDAITQKGVLSEIYKDIEGKRIRMGSSDPNGVYVTSGPGKMGERFIAVNHEYDPNSTDCPVTHATIPLKKTNLVRDVVAKAKFYASAGEAGAAAFEYQKAAQITKRTDAAQARKLEKKAALAFADKLSVKEPLMSSPPDGGVKPTAEFSAKIFEFQRKKGIKANGELTMETFKKAAWDRSQ